MKLNTIELDEKGIFGYEMPDKLAYRNLQFYLKEKEWNEALEAAKCDRVYFRPDDDPSYILFGKLGNLEKGKPYPIPDGYEVKIEMGMDWNVPISGLPAPYYNYAILVPNNELKVEHTDALDDLIYTLKIGCKITDGDLKILKDEVNKLNHFRDTSVGLWCIDQNPKDVSKEWIDKNVFQLGVDDLPKQKSIHIPKTHIEKQDSVCMSIEEAAEAYVVDKGYGFNRYITALDVEKGFIAGAKSQAAEIERLRMQLTACGVASMSNTEKSIKDQMIERSNPYWSPSYEQVCDAVKREIALRKELEQFKQEKP